MNWKRLIDLLMWAFNWNALLIKCSEETKINKERVDLKVGRRQAHANMALLIIHALLFQFSVSKTLV